MHAMVMNGCMQFCKIIGFVEFSWGPSHLELTLLGPILYPVEAHVHGPGLFGHDSRPAAIELCTVIGVGGCGPCISSNAMRWITPSSMLVNRVAASASEAADITLANMPAVFRIGPLGGSEVWSRLPKEKCPPSRLLPSCSDRYEASEWIFKITADLYYLMVALGCVSAYVRKCSALSFVVWVPCVCSIAIMLRAVSIVGSTALE